MNLLATCKRCLVVVAHPDDEVLLAGGLLAKLADAGAECHVLAIADGETSRGVPEDAIRRRERQATAAGAALGARSVKVLGLADQRLDSYDLYVLVCAVERVVNAKTPDLVVTHHPGDLNLDHALVARATLTACRPVVSPVRLVLGGEVPSSTEWGLEPFAPDLFVGVDVDRKLAALACYEGEARAAPHPRSPEAVRALATWRGATAGLPSAEAFRVLRGVVE